MTAQPFVAATQVTSLPVDPFFAPLTPVAAPVESIAQVSAPVTPLPVVAAAPTTV